MANRPDGRRHCRIAPIGRLMTPPADRDGEQPRTVEDALWIDVPDLTDAPVWMSASEALRWVEGFAICRDRHNEKITALGLDPGTVLDGPVVVLHPGQQVVRWERQCEAKGRVEDCSGEHCDCVWRPMAVTTGLLASGPEVAT